MHRLILTPAFASFVTVLVILAGSFVSLYSDDIKHAWPLTWHAPGPFSWHAFSSWAIAGAAAVAYFFRESFVKQQAMFEREESLAQQAAAQQRLVTQAEELERLVRTMPPENFLDSIAATFLIADSITDDALGGHEPPFIKDRITQAIRTVLRGIANTAKLFDGDNVQARYASNIMVFRSASSMTADEGRECQGRLRFIDAGVSIHHLNGVLDLVTEWSASTDACPDESMPPPDPHVKQIALPIPITIREMDTGLFKTLPGAPLAFVTNRPDVHADFKQLRSWCDKSGDFTESVKRDLDRYFDEHRTHMQSFVSLPLAPSGKEPFAVLNIHCRDPGMLRERRDAVVQFVATLRPIQATLVKLLVAANSGSQPAAESVDAQR